MKNNAILSLLLLCSMFAASCGKPSRTSSYNSGSRLQERSRVSTPSRAPGLGQHGSRVKYLFEVVDSLMDTAESEIAATGSMEESTRQALNLSMAAALYAFRKLETQDPVDWANLGSMAQRIGRRGVALDK